MGGIGTPTNMYRDRRVMCPFFRSQDRLTIGCEAPFDGPVINLRFKNGAEKEQQRSIFCEEHYKRCEIYRCVMANKYPEKDE